MFQSRGVQPQSTARPNAQNQIGPQPTAACVKLCMLDNVLTTHKSRKMH